MINPPALRIERARLRGGGPGGRERLESALALAARDANAAETEIGGRGLLVIRHLRMTQPLAQHGDARFAAALLAEIRARRRSARRGWGSGDCYFDDEIEVEVALVKQWLADPPAAARLVAAIGGERPMTRWRRHILPDPANSARAVARLAASGLAVPWLRQFEPGELANAAQAIAASHGAPALALRGFAGKPAVRKTPARWAFPDPARAALNAADATLPAGAAAASLVAVSAVATRRPDLLRATAFLDALSQVGARDVEPGVRKQRNARTGIMRHAQREPLPPLRDEEGPRPVGIAEQPAASAQAAASSAPEVHRTLPAALLDPPTGLLPAPAAARTTSEPFPSTGLARAQAQPLDTAFAGLWFLVNVFTALGLYGDFTEPRRGLAGLSPFELLLLLGRRWLGPKFEADPLSGLLRELAGLSPRSRAGRHFEAPAWKVPRAWLACWPHGRARVRHGRRWHPAGFPLSDRHRPTRNADARRRWLDGLARYIAARMAAALGESDPTRALALILHRPGQVSRGREHVVVHFNLESHPLAIRLAGLDRDPGWLPSGALDIRFVFA